MEVFTSIKLKLIEYSVLLAQSIKKHLLESNEDIYSYKWSSRTNCQNVEGTLVKILCEGSSCDTISGNSLKILTLHILQQYTSKIAQH